MKHSEYNTWYENDLIYLDCADFIFVKHGRLHSSSFFINVETIVDKPPWKARCNLKLKSNTMTLSDLDFGK